jgi:hypothetical protein
MPQSTHIADRVSSGKIVRADDDRRHARRQAYRTMPPRRSPSRRISANERPTLPGTRRFSRTDGRFDLPTVAGRTAKQIARRLA